MAELSPPLSGETLSRGDVERLIHDRPPVHLIDCDLDEASLDRLDLTGWVFERCTMRRATFAGARLERTHWIACRAAFCNLAGADLIDARFMSSDLNNANLRRTKLASASFTGCKLTGADLTEAATLGVEFSETLLINGKLPSLSFRRQLLRRVDLSRCDLRNCDFRETHFEDCSLRGALLTGARFDGADLRSADLGGLRLVDAPLFRGATISKVQAAQLLIELGLQIR